MNHFSGKILVSVGLGFYLCQPAVATLNISNKYPSVSQAVQVTENVWNQSQELYFRRARNDVKLFNQRDLTDTEQVEFFSSFTNVINKPFPSPTEERKHSLLRLRSLCVIEYTRNDTIRNNQKTWEAIAKHIGKIRTQIIPDYIPQANPLDEPYMQRPSKEKEQAIREYELKLSDDNFQNNLQTENRSLSGRLKVYIQNQRTHGTVDINYVHQLMKLARFSETEKQELLKWINQK